MSGTPASSRGLVDATFELVRPRLARLLVLLAPFQAAIVALYWRLPEDPDGPRTAVAAGMIWLSFLVASLALAAVALLVDGARRGAEPGVAAAWGRTLALAPRMAATHLLTSVLVVLALVPIVPGVFFATRFALMPIAVALRGAVAMDALRESRARVERLRRKLAALALVNLPILVVIFLIQNLIPTPPVVAVAWATSTVIAAFTSVAAALLWERLEAPPA